MIRRWCTRCKRMAEHKVVQLGDGMRRRDFTECQHCRRISPRPRLKSDWAGV